MDTRIGEVETVARLCGAAKHYGRQVALAGVDLSIERGRITALLGPNGAGKSTAVALLLGLTTPDAGRAELFGESPHRLAARRRIGVMLQSAALPETLEVGELLRLTCGLYPRPHSIATVARLAGLEELLLQRYGRLSGGQQRRVQFGLAVCGRPELLFLDEPTTGLDQSARERVWSTVRGLVAEGCAVLLTTHYLEEAEALAERIAVLARGRLVSAGSLGELRAQVIHRHIRCISGLGVEQVRTWEGVRAASRDAEWLDIHATRAEGIVRRMLAEDPELKELEVRRAGLAEVLREITHAEAHA